MAEEKKENLSVKDLFNGYSKKAESKKPFLIDIVTIVKIKFNQKHFGFAKDDIANVSVVASELYVGRGVASVVETK